MEEFSGGYYRTEMSVQPYDNGPVIEHTLYDFIDREVYAQTDAPITMRVGLSGGPHFEVDSESAIPANVLALPDQWMDDMDLTTDVHNVFVLKPQQSYMLNASTSQSVNERSE